LRASSLRKKDGAGIIRLSNKLRDDGDVVPIRISAARSIHGSPSAAPPRPKRQRATRTDGGPAPPGAALAARDVRVCSLAGSEVFIAERPSVLGKHPSEPVRLHVA
jgi:hypothetical protein